MRNIITGFWVRFAALWRAGDREAAIHLVRTAAERFLTMPDVKNRVPDAIFALASKQISARDFDAAEPLLLFALELKRGQRGETKGYYERVFEVATFYRDRRLSRNSIIMLKSSFINTKLNPRDTRIWRGLLSG